MTHKDRNINKTQDVGAKTKQVHLVTKIVPVEVSFISRIGQHSKSQFTRFPHQALQFHQFYIFKFSLLQKKGKKYTIRCQVSINRWNFDQANVLLVCMHVEKHRASTIGYRLGFPLHASAASVRANWRYCVTRVTTAFKPDSVLVVSRVISRHFRPGVSYRLGCN